MEVAVNVPTEHNPLTEKRWADYGFDSNALPRYKLRDVSQEKADSMGFSLASDGIYIEYPRDAEYGGTDQDLMPSSRRGSTVRDSIRFPRSMYHRRLVTRT
jgi:hypothetical protein